MKSIKILIVDDQKLFAECLSGILTGLGDGATLELRIAGSGEEALQILPWWRPDVVLLDIFMPGIGGLDTLGHIKTAYPEIKVLMLATFGYDNYVKEAMAGGASGFLLKDIRPQEVWASIMAVMEGQTVLSPAVADTLAGKHRPRDGQQTLLPSWFSLLNERERKILLLISKGLNNDEIADRLHLGKNTIRNYVSALYEKIDTRDRFGAIRIAIEAQIHLLVLE